MTSEKRTFRADRLRQLREARGLSQGDLVERLKIGVNQIYKYESGAIEPTSEALVRLAKELDVTTDYLLGLVDEPNAHYQSPDLTVEEHELVAAWRRKDWRGILRLLAEKL
jgi:transcriptional regulator with XRE-family HTH domain